MADPVLNTDTVAFIIEKAREFDAPEAMPIDEEAVPEPDPGVIGPALTTSVERGDLTATPMDDPAFLEARGQINALNIDEQCELVALAWIGRGDYSADDWAAAVRSAQDAHNNRTAEYLFGMPHLPDHLQAGLDALGR